LHGELLTIIILIKECNRNNTRIQSKLSLHQDIFLRRWFGSKVMNAFSFFIIIIIIPRSWQEWISQRHCFVGLVFPNYDFLFIY